MLKKKPLKPEQGFTVIEALFAILIATIFVTVAMQMMAIAAIFKARAQQNAEATTWIQEDLENVKLQATE
jgi:Tfp pilus assembly protein PilV